MAIKQVLMIGDPKLRLKSSEVTNFDEELEGIIADLKDTLTYLQDTKKIGRGLAAPQLGHMKRVIHYRLPNKSFTMINPKISWSSKEKIKVWDSCFSFDVAFFVEIERNKVVKVNFLDQNGKQIVKKFVNEISELVQHEIDHLNGILATDHLTDVKKIISRQEWEKRYK
ncbi:MAG: peptide deformylase [Candidatus Hodarchaeota archaeon]